jgi:hypothetical protein
MTSRNKTAANGAMTNGPRNSREWRGNFMPGKTGPEFHGFAPIVFLNGSWGWSLMKIV